MYIIGWCGIRYNPYLPLTRPLRAPYAPLTHPLRASKGRGKGVKGLRVRG